LKKINPSSSSKASNAASQQYLYLITRGRKSGRAREIEVWFTEHAGRFYVIAEYDTSNWLQNLRAHPDVQVRIVTEILEARARIVSPDTDPDLRQTVCDLSRQKYGWGEGTVVELSPVKRAPESP
jgi:deazaflavin-dependent oxidoreductase (nitroreductase family)